MCRRLGCMVILNNDIYWSWPSTRLEPDDANLRSNKISNNCLYRALSTSADNQVAHFTPVGVLISYLSQKLAWEHPEYRSLADYYRLTNFSGSGKGAMRKWDASIYSEEIRPRIQQELLSNGASWDE